MELGSRLGNARTLSSGYPGWGLYVMPRDPILGKNVGVNSRTEVSTGDQFQAPQRMLKNVDISNTLHCMISGSL